MKKSITIESILSGHSASQYFSVEGSYNSSIGIDPDYPIDAQVKTSGMIVPTVYAKLSGANIEGAPLWIMNNPKNILTYVYDEGAGVTSYNSSLASETNITSPTTSDGNGGAYYNNYLYLATRADIARYGPLDGSPSIAQNVWTAATLGSQVALGNYTYPSIRGEKIPNHPMHKHGDNSLYVGDVVNGQGVIHRIITTKTTVEGDTDDGSGYNVLDLPIGYLPVDIESYGRDLVILAIQTTDATINQGKAALFFWDTTDVDTFYNQVDLSDPIATALLNVNGILYMWSGNFQGGARLSQYIGGDSVQEIAFMEEGSPPLAGAVDSLGNRIVWGTYTTYPEASASVMALGSKMSGFSTGIHNVARSVSVGANQNVTALKYVQQDSNKEPKLVVGWKDDSLKGLDKEGSGTYNNVFRTNMINIGRKFSINKITIPLGATLAANMEIVPKIYIDDLSSDNSLTTINSTNYSGRKVVYKQLDLTESNGSSNFLIEFNFGGTVELPVLLPIIIDIDIYDDE